jgi:hypothetical protein
MGRHMGDGDMDGRGGVVAVLDILGVCGVDGGLVVLELVSVCGSAVRDLRLAGFLVMGL